MSLNAKSILIIYHRFHNLILYGVVGVFSASIDFLVFYTLNSTLNVFYLIANTISVITGISTSFFLNRKYNFKVKNKSLKRFVIFLSVGVGGLFISSFLLYLYVDLLSLNTIISKVLSIIFVVFAQFIINKSVTFNKNLI
jgi:putative flippase GtrA